MILMYWTFEETCGVGVDEADLMDMKVLNGVLEHSDCTAGRTVVYT